jgi:hypothetical protein
MNWSKNASFADRLSAAAEAKKAQLERAAQARSEAESPAAIKRRMARDAVKVARDARIAERRATKLAVEARQAAALAAAQAAEVAAREAALKAEQAEGLPKDRGGREKRTPKIGPIGKVEVCSVRAKWERTG